MTRPLHVTCLLVVVIIDVATAGNLERKLIRKLRSDYSKLERPVANSSLPVTVKLHITLQQIIDLDEKNQILSINAWLNYLWQDYQMVWSPDDYGGLADLRFPAELLWKPDVLLYNSVDSNFDSTYPVNMVVYSDGSINWIPPGIFKIACKIDITFFPFDEQRCFLKFGSWTFDGTKLDLQANIEVVPSGFDMSEYMVNGEWYLSSVSVNRTEKFYDCCPEPYPDLKFYMVLRRRTLYFAFNLILPCIMTAVMTILGFILPSDSGEKITLRKLSPSLVQLHAEITVMLSICFFLNIVSNMTPPTSEAVPLIGTFFSSCLFTVAASVVFTVIVLNMYYRSNDTHEMGHMTRSILLHWMPWALGMSRPGYEFKWRHLPPLFARTVEDTSESLLRNIRAGDDTAERHRHDSLNLEQRLTVCLQKLQQAESPMSIGHQGQILCMQKISSQLKYVTARMAIEDNDEGERGEWKFAAMVIDRLCMYVMTLATISSVGYIFLKAPYLSADDQSTGW